MKAGFIGLIGLSALATVVAANAQTPEHMRHSHDASVASGQRQLVTFPPEVREHFLSNMRGHLLALGDIMQAMSQANYAGAADIAETRLGMSSPAAAACKIASGSNSPAASTATDHADHPMQKFMPMGMRHAGMDMHEAASAFAQEARKDSKSGDATGALAALATVTQRCAACHAGYAVR